MGDYMGVAEMRLRDAILEQHRSVRAFALSLGLPCSTINNVLRRGVDSVNLSTAAALCGALGLDVAAFVAGEVRPAVDSGIAPWEQELLDDCRVMDDHGRELVSLVAHKERERCDGNRVAFPVRQAESWRQYVGTPIACRGGGVIAASEADAQQMDKIYRRLVVDRGETESDN